MSGTNGKANNQSEALEESAHGLHNNPDTSTFAQRLKLVIGQCSMTAFAQQCKLSESAIRKYIRGDSEPTLQNLLIISKVGNVSLSWLATGQPDTVTSSPSAQNNEISPPSFSINQDSYVINEVDFDSLAKDQQQYIPYNQWTLSKKWLIKEGLQYANLAFTSINCDSMGQVAKYGDIALINIKPQGWNGALEGVFIISLNNNLLIKRIQYDPIKHGYHLYSDNSFYRDHFIAINQFINFKIIAKIEHILTHVI